MRFLEFPVLFLGVFPYLANKASFAITCKLTLRLSISETSPTMHFLLGFNLDVLIQANILVNRIVHKLMSEQKTTPIPAFLHAV
ncbi:hypothetical protein BX667DRAFT_493854, partial [Coemansia mojavensis]